jgi:Sec-independent protein translocase protein TatA
VFGIGTPEVIVIGIISVIVLGGRLPFAARAIVNAIDEFKRGMNDRWR